jgi:hypothetical protein
MTKYTTRKNYFYQLAQIDPALYHGSDITEDGVVRDKKTFIQVADEQDSLNAGVVNRLDFPFVAQIGFNGSLTEPSGNIRTRYQNRLQFLSKAITDDTNIVLEYAKDAAYELTYQIMQNWIQRFYFDMGNLCPCPFKLDFNSFSWVMIGPIADQFYGWELQFSDDEPNNEILNGDPF